MRRGIKTFNLQKDPDSVLDWKVDWSRWLGDDTIVASAWQVPSGLNQARDASYTDTTTTIWLEGGTPQLARYEVVNHIATAGGREEDALLLIQVTNAF